MTITAYVYKTRVGNFSIELKPTGRWHVIWNHEDLGSFHSPRLALADLVGGHTHWPSCGDPSLLGMSDELSEWEPFERRVHFAQANTTGTPTRSLRWVRLARAPRVD
jgi:hypothetical protein